MREKISAKRRIINAILNSLVFSAALIIFVLVILMAGYILFRGLPHITGEFLTTKPSMLRETIGILPNILNTIYIIIITIMIVLPLGVGGAVYLQEYASNKKAVKVIELATETLAGIPSIIYGLVGMMIFVQFFKLGTSLIAGALTLVIMTLPTVIRTTQESLKTVPQSYREGAFALGAGKWYTIRTVVLPSAVDGIITGCILAIGRITGESAALLFTAGMANELLSPLDAVQSDNAGSTLTVSLYMYAKERGDFETAFAVAAVLLFISVIINVSVKIAKNKFKRGEEK